jgi:hypothetical protein
MSMALSEYEQQIADNVAEHGWFRTSVICEDPEPSWSYSVGFAETLGASECIIFCLPCKLMHAMLWSVFRQIKAGATLSDGERWSGLLQGFDCVSRPVHPKWIAREHFNAALWYWGDPLKKGRPLTAYQIVWPGALDGLFPWDPGCSDIVIKSQPALYDPRRLDAWWHSISPTSPCSSSSARPRPASPPSPPDISRRPRCYPPAGRGAG